MAAPAAPLRLLAISHPLRNPRADNHTIFNAPSLFDYDAIVIDPGRLFDTITEVLDGSVMHRTHADLRVANGEPTAAGAGLADLLHRRADELARALERGAVVAVFAYPQATLPQVLGFEGLHRYFLLPAPAGLGWDARLIRGGEGRDAAVTDHGHPFAPVIDALRGDLLYRAYFDDRAPGFAGNAHVIARSAGGGPVAVAFEVAGGHVVFLPTPRLAGGDASSPVAAALLEAMQAVLGRAHARPPVWVPNIHVAGLAGREPADEAAREALGGARLALAEAEHARTELASIRDLLWVEGDHVLLPAVRRALVLLGFEVARDGRLSAPEGELFLEAGAAEPPLGMAAHYRLRARLDEVIAEEQRAPRGLVVANGQRLKPPADRDQPHSESLRIAAEATGYALLPAPALFEAATAALAGLEPATLAAVRARLIGTDGLVELHDLITPAASNEGAAS